MWTPRSHTLIREKVYRTFGCRFKVYVELDNARPGFMVWSDTFTVEGQDALNGEGKSAAEIAQQMRQALAK